MNLINHLERRAKQHPERIALVDVDSQLTYTELYQKISAGSQLLRKDGLATGDCVLLLLPVSVELYVAFLSILHAGMTVMLLDPSAGKKTIIQSLRTVKVKACIGIPKAQLLRLLNPEVRAIERHYCTEPWSPFSRYWSPAAQCSSAPIEVAPSHPALITFTSGSTGKPKAACRTHGFLLAQHAALSESLDYKEGEVDLITLPVFAISNLASGLTSVIANSDLRTPGNVNALAVLEQCKQWKVTRCAASPAFFQSLLESDKLPPLDAIYTGGAPVFPHLLEKLQAKLPQAKVVTVFGSTEAEPIAHSLWSSTTEDEKSRMANGAGLLVGKPVSATRLRVITDQSSEAISSLSDEEFDAMSMPLGIAGEVVVTGEHVLKGYLNGTGDEEAKFSVNGVIWHRTGDAASIDVHGQVWMLGRCKAAVTAKNGDKIYPFGIECTVMQQLNIDRCALVSHHGKVTLCYQGTLTTTEQDTLLEQLKPLLVEQLKQLDQIPVDKRHNAKIDYPSLKLLLTE